jgi:hypothetical protein
MTIHDFTPKFLDQIVSKLSDSHPRLHKINAHRSTFSSAISVRSESRSVEAVDADFLFGIAGLHPTFVRLQTGQALNREEDRSEGESSPELR